MDVGKLKNMNEIDLKRYVKIVEANNTALTQHFIKQLLRLEERIEFLEERFTELRNRLLWFEKEYLRGEKRHG